MVVKDIRYSPILQPMLHFESTEEYENRLTLYNNRPLEELSKKELIEACRLGWWNWHEACTQSGWVANPEDINKTQKLIKAIRG